MKKWIPLIVFCCTFLCMAVFAEICFGLLLESPPARFFGDVNHCFEPHPVLGHQLAQGNCFGDHYLRQEVGELSGAALYVYAGFYMNRMIGGMPEFNLWADRLTHFDMPPAESGHSLQCLL